MFLTLSVYIVCWLWAWTACCWQHISVVHLCLILLILSNLFMAAVKFFLFPWHTDMVILFPVAYLTVANPPMPPQRWRPAEFCLLEKSIKILCINLQEGLPSYSLTQSASEGMLHPPYCLLLRILNLPLFFSVFLFLLCGKVGGRWEVGDGYFTTFWQSSFHSPASLCIRRVRVVMWICSTFWRWRRLNV